MNEEQVRRIEEYKAGLYKDVEMPSGLVFTIKKAGIDLLAKFTEYVGTGKIDEDEMARHMPEISRVLIPGCVVEPVIRSESEEVGEGELSLDMVSWEDATKLIEEIMNHSGFESEEREDFRQQKLQEV